MEIGTVSQSLVGYPLAPQQKRIWQLRRAYGNAPFQNVIACRITGEFRLDALQSAFATMEHRYEILRSSLRFLPGMAIPLQIPTGAHVVYEGIQDVSGLTGSGQQAAIDQCCCEMLRALDDSPALSWCLLRLSDTSHIAVLRLSSIFGDMLTLRRLVEELSYSYNDCKPLRTEAEDVIQYGELAEWQGDLLVSEETTAGRDHWLKALTQLPETRIGAATQIPPFTPDFIQTEVARRTSEKLGFAANSLNGSAATIVLACWASAVARFAEANCVTVGCTMNGRRFNEIARVHGPFARVIPLAIPADPRTSLADMARAADSALGEATEWQEYFCWRTPEEHSDLPFTSVCFEFETSASKEPLIRVASVGCIDRFDVKLSWWRDCDRSSVTLAYNAEAVPKRKAQRLLDTTLALLDRWCEQLESPAGDIDWLTTAERGVVLGWAKSAVSFPASRALVHHAFEQQASLKPDALAIVDNRHQYTYAGANALANRLARLLMRFGAAPDKIVAICMGRDANLIISLLATLKTNAAFAVLDIDQPEQRLASMLRTLAPVAVVTSLRYLDRLLAHALPTVCIDHEGAEFLSYPQENLENSVDPRNMAYVLFTSGSTGAPKGVAIEHASIANYVTALQHKLNLPLAANYAVVSTLAADLGYSCVFPALCSGGTLHVISEEQAFSASAIAEYFAAHHIDCCKIVPSHLAALLGTSSNPAPLPSKVLVLGGETLSTDLVSRITKFSPACRVFNHYGPTESTIGVLTHPVAREAGATLVIPIGRPLPGIEVYILDPMMQPVPVGVAGQLCIGGLGLARGYLQAPELTAERFVPNPFDKRGGRLYCTGDLARFNEAGKVEFLGRCDHQVKIRGFRIELGEIEAALGSHPYVQEAVVIAREEAPSDKRLVAYVTPHRERAYPLLQLLKLNADKSKAEAHRYDLPIGRTIIHQHNHETEFLYKEIFEEHVYAKHGIELADDSCIVDVGANIGMFTLYVAWRCPNARIYAFEPKPPAFQALSLNVSLYGINAEVFNCALGANSEPGKLIYYPNVSLISGRYGDAAADQAKIRSFLLNQKEIREQLAGASEQSIEELQEDRLRSEQIESQFRRLSDVIHEQGIGTIDLLKVGVEKSELDVLAGIDDGDWARIRQVVVEVYDRDGALATCRALLEEHGFSVECEQSRSLKNTGLYNVYARKLRWAQPSAVPLDRKQLQPCVANAATFTAALRERLRERLPEYMTPSAIVLLDELPLTPNGKLDRRALPAPDKNQLRSEHKYVGPRTPVEETLADIWRAVLRVERVGVHDNFFELGGDSILSIQIVARANQAGLRLTPRQMFEHQTVACLASAATQSSETPTQQGLVWGAAPLTPIQRWFFEQDLPRPHHFNQAVLLRTSGKLEPAVIESVAAAALAHHDALRLRFESGAGGWTQRYGAERSDRVCGRIDLSAVEPELRAELLERAASAVQGGLDLTYGPLARMVSFDLGEAGRRLLVAIHHLLMDGVSWRILLQDLETACIALLGGAQPQLPPKTSSLRAWAERLMVEAAAGRWDSELDFWLEQASGAAALPVDFPEGGNTVRSAGSVTVSLGEEETRALLQEAPKAYRTQIQEVLLTALADALGQWTGREEVTVDVEGHGREEAVEGVDISRTVGWFTTIYPLRLESLRHQGPGERLKRMKEAVRRTPNKGIGYGLLRYAGSEAARRRLAEASRPEVAFNYLGQFDKVLTTDSLFAGASESAGAARAMEGERAHAIEINGSVSGGRLRMSWSYSRNLHRRKTIEAVAQSFLKALRELIAHCRSEEAGGYTPSDFPLAGLTQEELDRVTSGREVEDIYCLSPMQEGMLFHALYEPEAWVYFDQFSCELEGELNEEAFKRAWSAVVDRHAILRTGFVWGGVGRAVQVVERGVELGWEREDWSGLSGEEQRERLARHLESDRKRGFDLGRGPLMRVWLCGLGENRRQLVWSRHHLLMDGWCVPVILREVLAAYGAAVEGGRWEPGPVRPYRDYIAWLQRQKTGQAEAFWREQLRGFEAPTRLPIEGVASGGVAAEHWMRLNAEATMALQAWARGQQVTVNTVAQGAWAMLLSRYSGEKDVLFGATVSGRPAELAGVESMIGLFINTLPVRVNVEGKAEIGQWLRRLQERQAEARQYEYTPLVQIQGLSEAPRGMPLFESLLVFENYPDGKHDEAKRSKILVKKFRSFDTVNYPITVAGVAEPVIGARFLYDQGRADRSLIERMAVHFQTLLEGIASADPTDIIAWLPMLPPAERDQILYGWNETTREYPHGVTLPDIFEEQARRNPTAVAIISEAGAITYGNLNARANQLAGYLCSLGVGPEELVALCLDRSAEMIVAMLAVLKAGGAYLPLDPDNHPDRINQMMRDASAAIVLTNEVLAEKLRSINALVVCLDRDWPEIARHGTADLARAVGPDNLAYVIYTSGSTGIPKGILVPHRAILRLVLNTDYAQIQEFDTVAQASNASFDAATFEVWGALLNGASLAVLPRSDLLDPHILEDRLKRLRISVLFLTTALFNKIAAINPACFATLRYLLFGGEASDPRAVARAVAEKGGCKVLHVYGPTENTTFSTWFEVTRIAEDVATVPIGKPITNSACYVLGSDLEPVPPSAIGELFVGGEGVARDYLNLPAQTAEKFIPDLYGPRPGARLYRTGDLVRQFASGNLIFIGRTDRQVKIRGFRIELEEVEAVLGAHERVREVAAVVREDTSGEKRLVAYITASPEGVSIAELRAYAAEHLPGYMIPSTIIELDAMPLNPNGKLDRNELPAPTASNQTRAGVIEARDSVELELVDLWQEALDVRSIGVKDDFFALGGNSIIALTLNAQMETRFGVRLPLAALFESGTIEQIAGMIRQGKAQAPVSPLVALRSTGRKAPLFCVHPGGGGVACFATLANELDAERPVYGLQSKGLYSDELILTRVEDMAAAYITAIRAARPDGPYNLCGWSFGGLVAYEMAQQLAAAGERVGAVALIDTGAHTPEAGVVHQFPDESAMIVAALEGVVPLTREELSDLDTDARLLHVLEKARSLEKVVPDMQLPQARRLLDIFRTNYLAQAQYIPKAYPGRVAVFCAPETESRTGDPLLGWDKFALGGVRTCSVSGNHINMLDHPHVQAVAKSLAQCLDEADGQAVTTEY